VRRLSGPRPKLARYADASGVVALHLVRGCVDFSDIKLGNF